MPLKYKPFRPVHSYSTYLEAMNIEKVAALFPNGVKSINSIYQIDMHRSMGIKAKCFIDEKETCSNITALKQLLIDSFNESYRDNEIKDPLITWR